MVKRVLCCCVHGRHLFSNPVTYALVLITQYGDFSESLSHNVNVYEIIIIESTTWQVSFYTNKIVSNSPLVTAIIDSVQYKDCINS